MNDNLHAGAELAKSLGKEVGIKLFFLAGAQKIIIEVIRVFLKCRNHESDPLENTYIPYL